ncbi:DUF6887 family protein [Merismopedia glauca]|nr:hypothetical protein [Merismopedia glauca]
MKSKFEAMSREELRGYITKHREDEKAFQIYLDRAIAEPGEVYPAPQTIDDLSNFSELLANNRRNKELKSK